jgi:thioredoxin reductase
MSIDVIVVGAGPAGLSAALILGRCCRQVLVLDAGRPRNAASRAMHGFLSRDGIAPAELLQIGREQLKRYSNVRLMDAEVVEARRLETGFNVQLADGTSYRSQMLLLATGVVDELPQIEGIESFYGQSVFHCPYCDGWEVRGRPLAAYGCGDAGAELALELTRWSEDVLLFTDGHQSVSSQRLQRLSEQGVGIHSAPIARLEGDGKQLKRIVLANGESIERTAMFFSTSFDQRSSLAARLGCRLSEKGAVETGEYEQTGIPGLFVAGDASREVQLAIVAAAEGAKAAFAINTALTKADLRAAAR